MWRYDPPREEKAFSNNQEVNLITEISGRIFATVDEGTTEPSIDQTQNPTHSSGKREATILGTSYKELPTGRQRNSPLSITLQPATPALRKKRLRDVSYEQPNESALYNKSSRRKLQHEIDDTPVAALLPTVNPSTSSDAPPESREEEVTATTQEQEIKNVFPIFDKILKHPEIILRLAAIIDVQSLVDLYAISKPFHFIVNSHFTTYIRSSAQIHAPDAAYVFPWRCYRRLTLKDPGFRLNSTEISRDVPGLKWLQMVSTRHTAVMQIVQKMNEAGHKFPGEPNDIVLAIKKIWFMMDLARNGPRIGVIHNTEYWTDRDIFMATFFVIKLSMRFTDPVEGFGEQSMLKLMLGQRSLYPLRDLLMGKLNKLRLLRMWVLYDWVPSPENRHLPCMGVAPEMIGRGCLENWGFGGTIQRMLRPDELLVKENVRRGLELHMQYFDMVRWGYELLGPRAKTKGPKLGESKPFTEFVDRNAAKAKLDEKAREESEKEMETRKAAMGYAPGERVRYHCAWKS